MLIRTGIGARQNIGRILRSPARIGFLMIRMKKIRRFLQRIGREEEVGDEFRFVLFRFLVSIAWWRSWRLLVDPLSKQGEKERNERMNWIVTLWSCRRWNDWSSLFTTSFGDWICLRLWQWTEEMGFVKAVVSCLGTSAILDKVKADCRRVMGWE